MSGSGVEMGSEGRGHRLSVRNTNERRRIARNKRKAKKQADLAAHESLVNAIENIAGTQGHLAELMNQFVSPRPGNKPRYLQQHVSLWVKSERGVPPAHVVPFALATGLSLDEVRPDMYSRQKPIRVVATDAA